MIPDIVSNVPENQAGGPSMNAPDGLRIRVASWNIRKAVGRDLRRNPGRILDVVADLGADVVALQEADFRFNGRRAIFNADQIAERTGLIPVAFENAHAGLGWHGNILLVAPRVTVRDCDVLHLKGLEPRGAIRADLMVGGHDIRLVAAHLALLAPIRLLQATALARASLTAPGMSSLVIGDFNAWRRDALSLRPLTSTMSVAPTGRSFPASRPIVQLDRIFHRGPMHSVGSGACCDLNARTASDHLPIWTDFEVDDPETS